MDAYESKGLESEGLGASLLLYMAAVVCALALIALPVYLANAPEVYENAPLARPDPLLKGPIIGNRASTGIPLALLTRPDIVSPATLAALDPKSKKAEASRQPAHRTAQLPAGTPVADLQPERLRRSSFFPFNLF